MKQLLGAHPVTAQYVELQDSEKCTLDMSQLLSFLLARFLGIHQVCWYAVHWPSCSQRLVLAAALLCWLHTGHCFVRE